MKRISFEQSAFEDFQFWASSDKTIYAKITTLLKDILRSPFVGIGQPEPLKYDLKGFWSRRITREHRLVYKVTESKIIVVSCRYHYK